MRVAALPKKVLEPVDRTGASHTAPAANAGAGRGGGGEEERYAAKRQG